MPTQSVRDARGSASVAVSDADPIVRMRRRLRAAERELAEERERSQRLAEINGEKSRFLSLASHELRGPLTILMGHLSLLEEGAYGDFPDGFARTLPLLNSRIAEMEVFTNAMLEISRLDEDRLRLLCTPLDLRDAVQEALQRSQVFARDDLALKLRMPRPRCSSTPIAPAW